jgi:hypothetical protein
MQKSRTLTPFLPAQIVSRESRKEEAKAGTRSGLSLSQQPWLRAIRTHLIVQFTQAHPHLTFPSSRPYPSPRSPRPPRFNKNSFPPFLLS